MMNQASHAVRELSSRFRAFARHSLNFSNAPTSDDEDDEEAGGVADRGVHNHSSLFRFYTSTERQLGVYFPIALFSAIMAVLFFSAVFLVAVAGDGQYRAAAPATFDTAPPAGGAVTTTTSAPNAVTGGTITTTTTTYASPEEGFIAQHANAPSDSTVATLSLFFAMSFFSVLTTMLAYRLMQRARSAAAEAGTGTQQRSPTNPMIQRLLMLGQIDPNVRQRLRLALINRDFDGNDYELLNQLDEHNPTTEAASEREINRLPIHTVTQAFVDSGAADAATGPTAAAPATRFACTICLAPYEAGDVVRTVLCMHSFHKHCIDSWLRTKNEVRIAPADATHAPPLSHRPPHPAVPCVQISRDNGIARFQLTAIIFHVHIYNISERVFVVVFVVAVVAVFFSCCCSLFPPPNAHHKRLHAYRRCSGFTPHTITTPL